MLVLPLRSRKAVKSFCQHFYQSSRKPLTVHNVCDDFLNKSHQNTLINDEFWQELITILSLKVNPPCEANISVACDKSP